MAIVPIYSLEYESIGAMIWFARNDFVLFTGSFQRHVHVRSCKTEPRATVAVIFQLVMSLIGVRLEWYYFKIKRTSRFECASVYFEGSVQVMIKIAFGLACATLIADR